MIKIRSILLVAALSLIGAGCAHAVPVQVNFALTNYDATISTNAIIITPVSERTFFGDYVSIGQPIRIPTTNGLCSRTFLPGDYEFKVANQVWRTNIIFAVPSQGGPYTLNQLWVSGGNVFNYGGSLSTLTDAFYLTNWAYLNPDNFVTNNDTRALTFKSSVTIGDVGSPPPITFSALGASSIPGSVVLAQSGSKTVTLGQGNNLVINADAGLLTFSSSAPSLFGTTSIGLDALNTFTFGIGDVTTHYQFHTDIFGTGLRDASSSGGITIDAGVTTIYGSGAAFIAGASQGSLINDGSGNLAVIVDDESVQIVAPHILYGDAGGLGNLQASTLSGIVGIGNTPAFSGGVVTKPSGSGATAFGSFASSALLTALNDETGTGSIVAGTNPILVSPYIGANDAGFERLAASIIRPSTGVGAGAGWITAGAGGGYVTADINNTTTTLNSGSIKSMQVITGRKYAFTLVAFCVEATAGDGIKFDFGGGGATATYFQAHAKADNVLGTPDLTTLAATVTIATLTGSDMVVIKGAFEPSSTGSFVPRFAKNSGSTGNCTVKRGSYIILTDIP